MRPMQLSKAERKWFTSAVVQRDRPHNKGAHRNRKAHAKLEMVKRGQEQGLTAVAIAEENEVSLHSVYRIAREHGLDWNDTSARRKRCWDAIRAGQDPFEAALANGYTRPSAFRLARQLKAR